MAKKIFFRLHSLFIFFLLNVCAPKSISVNLDLSGPVGPRFDGVGGVSGGGGGSRLLIDYPDKQRSEIYDLLFKPQYGASLQALKVEIGCGGDTTQGSEQSFMRGPDEKISSQSFRRGYENQLMAEARLRNPNIHLSGMQWGAPNWVAEGGESIFTESNKNYLINWIKLLRTEGPFVIDSLGVSFNEGYYNKTWIIEMKARLNSEGFGAIKTIAADFCCGRQYKIATDMLSDPELRDAVDIIGTHCPGTVNGQKSPTDEMMGLGVPFWDTEQHLGVPDPRPWGLYDFRGFIGAAQVINRNYIDANHVATWMWTPIYSWYDWISFRGKGLMAANEPWSGYYNASGNTPMWAVAHTTQFTEPGWNFLGKSFDCSYDGSPCGSIGDNSTSGSYVTYISPNRSDVTLVIETFGRADITIIFIRSEKSLYLWTSKRDATFIRSGQTYQGEFQIEIPPDQLWTLTSLKGGQKGSKDISPPESKPFPLPFSQDFNNLHEDRLVPYFSDMNGEFSAGSIDGRRCLVQRLTEVPLATHSGRNLRYFSTAIGDSSMRQYTVSLQMMSQDSNSTLFVGMNAGVHNVGPDKLFDSLSNGIILLMHIRPGNATAILQDNGEVLQQRTNLEIALNTWFQVTMSVVDGMSHVVLESSRRDVTSLVGGPVSSDAGPVFMGCGHHLAYFDDIKIIPQS